MANPVFQAVVTTLDRSSPVLATIRRGIEGMSGAAMRAQIATQRLALAPAGVFGRMRRDVAGLGGHFATLRGHLGGLWSGLTSLMPPLAALGTGTTLAGLFGLVKHVAEAREETLHMAEVLDTTPQLLARFNFVAKMTGTNVEAAQTGMTKLNRVMGDAARGKNKSALDLFQHMHISLNELKSGNAMDILPKIADAYQHTTSTTLQSAVAVTLFGKAGQLMKPMLRETPAQLRAWVTELGRLGYKFTEVDDQNLTKFRRSWLGLETAVGGFTNVLGAMLAPVLEPVIGQFRDWIAVNRRWTAEDITYYVSELVDWLKDPSWKETKDNFKYYADKTWEWIQWIGPLKVALIAVGAVTFGPLIGGIALATAGILGLTANVISLGVAMNAIQVPAWMAFLMRIGAPLAALLLTGPAGQILGEGEPEEKQKEENVRRKEQYRREHPEYREPWEQLKGLLFGGAPSPSGTPPASGQGASGGLGGALPWGLTPQLAPLPGTRPGGFGPLQIFPNLYTPSAAPGATGPQGLVDVNVRFDNAPPGMRVETTSTGQVRVPQADVGYAFGFEQLGYA